MHKNALLCYFGREKTRIFAFRQLLGTEEESSDHATSEEEELMMENFPTSNVVGSTMASMVASGKRSVWSITREQINYYTTQFFCLQSDPKGVIPGEIFFRQIKVVLDLLLRFHEFF